jgi:hypothetical protein
MSAVRIRVFEMPPFVTHLNSRSFARLQRSRDRDQERMRDRERNRDRERTGRTIEEKGHGTEKGTEDRGQRKGTDRYNRREGGAPGSAKIARVHYTEPMGDPK